MWEKRRAGMQVVHRNVIENGVWGSTLLRLDPFFSRYLLTLNSVCHANLRAAVSVLASVLRSEFLSCNFVAAILKGR